MSEGIIRKCQISEYVPTYFKILIRERSTVSLVCCVSNPVITTFVHVGYQNFNFLNMVMWHIKLKGMISRPGYNENFYLRIKLVTLGRGQKVKKHYRFLQEPGDSRWRAIECVLVYFLNEIATRSYFFRILSLLHGLSLRCA